MTARTMEVQFSIEFDQLVKIIKGLSKKQLGRLLAEVQTSKAATVPGRSLEEILLHGPVATQKELDIIAENRKAIDQWQLS